MVEIVRKIYVAQSSGDPGKPTSSPAVQFAPMVSTFRRRLTVGLGTASLVAVGANFGGLTSFLLGFAPENGRNLKLDLVYPIGGYSRCVASNEGFEFVYPASWVGDQTLLYRAAARTERARPLDPPPLSREKSGKAPPENVNEPVVAFGPPGSSGELNVSVIVATVPPDFSIESFGGPNAIGEAVVRAISSRRRGPEVKGTLIESKLRSGSGDTSYYELEFRVTSSTFQRHNVAVCTARRGKLYTLNAQAPESTWENVRDDFQKIAHSFVLIQ